MNKKLLLLCLLLICGLCHTAGKTTFKVLQMNLWHGTTKVPGGEQGVIDILEQTDPDVVFFCEIRDGRTFIPKLIEEMKKGFLKVEGDLSLMAKLNRIFPRGNA